MFMIMLLLHLLLLVLLLNTLQVVGDYLTDSPRIFVILPTPIPNTNTGTEPPFSRSLSLIAAEFSTNGLDNRTSHAELHYAGR